MQEQDHRRRADMQDSAQSAENAYKEVEIIQHLSGHLNIVTLFGVYEDVESLHLVMEVCSGGRLVDSMKKRILFLVGTCKIDLVGMKLYDFGLCACCKCVAYVAL
ncbi:hypothetical protein SUGI_1113530 [Cryptomeria japonica]|nr:hypothetical protein SUGI_1113530 [Cryptomeria japonica]